MIDLNAGLLVGIDTLGIFFDSEGRPLKPYQDLNDSSIKVFGHPIEAPMEAGSILASMNVVSRFWEDMRTGKPRMLFGYGNPWEGEKTSLEISLITDQVIADLHALGVSHSTSHPLHIRVWPVGYVG